MAKPDRWPKIGIAIKLSSVPGVAVLAFCAMGLIAVYTARDIHALGVELQTETTRLADLKYIIAVDIERASGEVNAAPSELDLVQLKTRQDRFKALIKDARAVLTGSPAITGLLQASEHEIDFAIGAIEAGAATVFEKAAAFAQPEAIAALQDRVKPAQLTLESALRRLDEAVAANSVTKTAVIEATIATVTWTVAGLAAALLLGIAASGYAMVSRGVVHPLIAMELVMVRLSGGDTGVAVPSLRRSDEVGAMARAVQIFKDGMIEAERLRQEQEMRRRQAAADRVQGMLDLATRFESGVGDIVDSVSAAATKLQATAQSMTTMSENTAQQSATVAAASGLATLNVQTVASATEQLSASIREISEQVTHVSGTIEDSVRQALTSTEQVRELATSAEKIGDVVKIISDIAAQTNLLALNATIEAARAGDAGKGFAVVASEVKTLAAQTAKATEVIAAQVKAIQDATRSAARAIEGVSDTIAKVNETAAAIASAVEEQGAATQDISRNVLQAAHGTEEVSSNIVSVSDAAQHTGAAATQVLAAANQLSRNGEALRAQLRMLLQEVRAA